MLTSRSSQLQSLLFIKELLSLPENMLQFSQLQEVLLQSLRILIDLSQLVFQLLECCLQINHFSRLRCLRGVSCVNQSDISILICHPIRNQYSYWSTNKNRVLPVSSIGISSFFISFSKNLSFLSISSHLLTSLTNFLWNALMSGLRSLN